MVRKYWIEIKYIVLACLFLGGLVYLAQAEAFAGLNDDMQQFMDFLAQFGFVGMLILGVVGNSSLLIQIPYTVPLVSVALNGASFEHLLFLGLGAGIGAGIGEIISYLIADKILALNPDLAASRLYRWVDQQVQRRPRLIPWLIFVWAASILPDDTVLIPLAMIKYGLRRIYFPLFFGKVAHNLVFATLLYAATEQMSERVSTQVQADLALGILVAFVLVIFYQVEKTKNLQTNLVVADSQ